MLKPDSYVQPNMFLTPSLLPFQGKDSYIAHADLENCPENTLVEKNQIEHPPAALVDRPQDDLPPPSSDELLDESSLKTVLDMLEVIDCVAELDLLETLTLAQKKQVWALTPEATRFRLKQIRAAALNSGNTRSPLSLNSTPASTATSSTVAFEATLTATVEKDEVNETEVDHESHDDAEDTEETDELALGDAIDDSALSQLTSPIPVELWQNAPPSLAGGQPNQVTAPLLQSGDWVVLHANPKLTMAEMIAIWEVLEVQGRYARIKAKKVGTRHYPIAWMVIYPKPPSDAVDNEVNETLKDDMAELPSMHNPIETIDENDENDEIETDDDEEIEF